MIFCSEGVLTYVYNCFKLSLDVTFSYSVGEPEPTGELLNPPTTQVLNSDISPAKAVTIHSDLSPETRQSERRIVAKLLHVNWINSVAAITLPISSCFSNRQFLCVHCGIPYYGNWSLNQNKVPLYCTGAYFLQTQNLRKPVQNIQTSHRTKIGRKPRWKEREIKQFLSV
jgi:hypothetical protein